MIQRGLRNRAVRVALTWTVALLPLVLVALAIQSQWSDVSHAGGLPGWGPFGLAVAANVVGNVVLILAWRHQIHLAGAPTPPRAASAAIWSTSQLSRLIFPGAPVASRAALARRYGVRASVGAWTTLLEMAWQLSVGPVVILLTFPAWDGVAGAWTWLGLFAIVPGALLATLVVRPSRALALVAGLLRRIPGLATRIPTDIESVSVDLRPGQAAGLAAMYAANYAVRTLAFLVLLAGVTDLDGGFLALAVGASALGRFIGSVAIFAPGGLGPREGIIALMLAPTIGTSVLVLVATARLAELVAEAGVFVVGRLSAGPPRPPSEADPDPDGSPVPESAVRAEPVA